MDGVLADFNAQPNAIERFGCEPGFFQKLEPLPYASVLNKQLLNEQFAANTYILSASPNTRADIDKMLWLWEHIPNLDSEHVIFVRSGNAKAEYAKGNILIDDYSDNLLYWESKGGYGIKFLNGSNGNSRKWKGQTLSFK